MSRSIQYAILGAGNGGLTMAGDLGLHGFRVSGLYDRFEEAIAPVRDRGGVELVGEVMTGFAPIANATTDMGTAVDGADVIVVVVPAFAHEWIARELAPHLVDGQIVVLTPGYPGGTLAFLRTLCASGLTANIDLAETNLILYSTRIVGPAQVGIKGIKRTLFIAAYPAARTAHVVDTLKPAIPQLEPMANVLEVGFNCTNPYSHVPTAILNWGRVEQDTGEHHFDWHDWITPGIELVQAAMEAERASILKAAGLRYLSEAEMVKSTYGGEKWRIVPVLGEIRSSSRTIPPRYVDEDVPMGLVAYTSLACIVGIETPVHDMMIDLAGILKQTDFRKTGRTLERMGLRPDMSMKEILASVH